jgi:hypothetical protein
METKFKIVEEEEYIFAVSGEGIKKGDYHRFTCFDGDIIKKIIAYKPKGNVIKLDLPLLPEIVVEDDVEKLAEKYADFSNDYIPISFGGKFNETSKRDFIAGYKAATKVYSEEDIDNAYIQGSVDAETGGNKRTLRLRYLEYLKLPKTPKWFVAETFEDKLFDMHTPQYDRIVIKLKTTTINNNTYLVGTYLN